MSKAVKIIAAAAIGFAAGILLAPKSGKETREDIKHRALGAKDFAYEKADQVKVAAAEAGETLKGFVPGVNKEAEGLKASARRSAGVVADEATKLGNEAKTRATRVAGEAKRTASRVQKDASKRLG
jgi:gas vesicle protein